jgi:hypothetical protein
MQVSELPAVADDSVVAAGAATTSQAATTDRPSDQGRSAGSVGSGPTGGGKQGRVRQHDKAVRNCRAALTHLTTPATFWHVGDRDGIPRYAIKSNGQTLTGEFTITEVADWIKTQDRTDTSSPSPVADGVHTWKMPDGSIAEQGDLFGAEEAVQSPARCDSHGCKKPARRYQDGTYCDRHALMLGARGGTL